MDFFGFGYVADFNDFSEKLEYCYSYGYGSSNFRGIPMVHSSVDSFLG